MGSTKIVEQYSGDVFNKRKECAAKKEILVESNNRDDAYVSSYVESVFYSPKRDSCLYTYYQSIKAHNSKEGLIKVDRGNIELRDAFDDSVLLGVGWNEISPCNGCTETVSDDEKQTVTLTHGFQTEFDATTKFQQSIQEYR